MTKKPTNSDSDSVIHSVKETMINLVKAKHWGFAMGLLMVRLREIVTATRMAKDSATDWEILMDSDSDSDWD